MSTTAFDLTGLAPDRVLEIDVMSESFRQNWVEHMADWGNRPPFYAVWGGTAMVMCGRYADVMTVYSDRDRFSVEVPNQPGSERFDKFMGIQTLAQLDGARHDRLRKLVNPTFGPEATAKFEPELVSIIDAMLDAIPTDGSVFDVMAVFCDHLMVRVMLDGMFGLDGAQKRVFNRMRMAIPLAGTIAPGGDFPKEYVDAFAAAKATILALIAERRAHPGDDHISRLILAREENDALTDIELYDQIFTLCVAALQSTASSMGGVLLNLWRNPRELALLRADRSLLSMAVEESLRCHGAGLFTFPRWARADTEVGGTPIRAGMVVRAANQAAAFDPTVYPNPLRFDIRRNPQKLLAFGWGPHFCIGRPLARLVLRHALERILDRFPTLELVDPSFRPVYRGQVGEIAPAEIPMRVRQSK